MPKRIDPRKPIPDPAGFRVVATTVIVQSRHIVMVREGSGRDARRWNLPGGKADQGESVIDAALRETWEETGYEVELTGLIGIYSYRLRANRPRVRVLLSAEVVDGEPCFDGKEIIAVRWFHIDQLKKLKDSELAKPRVLRPILDDLRRPRQYPLRLLKKFDPHYAAA